ncbi:TPA: hypothetical protein RQJ82_004446 [Vibrio vulnificus]|nr:hypothetical protein [Vibrio vulnificus]
MNKWFSGSEPLQGGMVDDSGNPTDTGGGPTIQPGTPDHLKHGGKHNVREEHEKVGGQQSQVTSTNQASSSTNTTSDDSSNDTLNECEKEFDGVFQAIRSGIASLVDPFDVNVTVSLPSITFASNDNGGFSQDITGSEEMKILATRPIAGKADALAVFLIKKELHIIMDSQAAKHFTTRVAKNMAKPFCDFVDFKLWFEGLPPEEQWELMGRM